ncbi:MULTISPECIES: IclR family transcriptional regulator [Actinomadura]|uniref:IclR family transcriptional regulator n=1 Tax=Actinomadura TaxID=1988 RepID=UPI0004193615|nr:MULTISPECIES: IclR family transcriptional regulator [Actinomadura]RSN72084.1 IclR family transcriptional regulator [Actinomadura sp. WAC 06369]
MPEPARRRSGAESARKVLQILLEFDEERPTRGAADLAAALDMPSSSMYRYLSVLRETGMIEEVGTGEYRLSWVFVRLAGAARAGGRSLEDTARPVLESIVEDCGETALLIKRIGWSAVCVDRVDSPHHVRLQFTPGEPMSLHEGSAARVLLASMPATERRRYLASAPELTEPVRDQLETDVETIGRIGWTESFGEVDDGIWGVSAAIRDQGRVVAALGVAGPLYRLQQNDRARIIQLVISGAEEITGALDRA